MSARDVLAVVVLVWLIGAVVGWCAGWMGRGEHNRAWHAGVAAQLSKAQAELAEALDELDATRGRWELERLPAPAPSVVHVHVAAPECWASPPPVLGTVRVFDALPALPMWSVDS